MRRERRRAVMRPAEFPRGQCPSISPRNIPRMIARRTDRGNRARRETAGYPAHGDAGSDALLSASVRRTPHSGSQRRAAVDDGILAPHGDTATLAAVIGAGAIAGGGATLPAPTITGSSCVRYATVVALSPVVSILLHVATPAFTARVKSDP